MPPHYQIESGFTGIIAGIDEAGCGPWAGPVVAAAAVVHTKRLPKGIDDSKKTTHAQREALLGRILSCVHSAVGIATVVEIDDMNILQARLLAMQRAFAALMVVPDVALVDGNRAPVLPCRVQTIIEGDAQSMSIAAASIIAKITRDRIMQELAQRYPGYGWETNAGYGTKAHQRALAELGVTPEHRRSFKPIAQMLQAAAA